MRTSETRAAESLAARVLERVPALADALARTIQEQNPGYRTAQAVSRDDLLHSCHDNINCALQLIAQGAAGGDVLGDDGRYAAARATGRRRAEQRMPLEDVLRSFRLGGRLVWEALIDQAQKDNLANTDGLLDLATLVWEVVDAISAQVSAAYHAAESAALWEGLLRGRAKDPAFAREISQFLGMPVDGSYAVVVADTGASTAQLRQRLAAEGIESAWQARTGLLALRRPTLDVAVGVLREALPVPAGVSLVVRGLAEVDTAYRQAELARRTVLADHTEVAVLHERLPDALLLSAPELARQLVDRWLGRLLKVPPAERRLLLGTLQIWVSTGGSIKQTADAACCHRNTVLNRLQRMAAITGHDFADPGHLVELTLALRASVLLSD